MVAIPGLPNVTTLPLDKVIGLSGVQAHSSWLGGVRNHDRQTFTGARFGFGFKDWDFYLSAGGGNKYSPDNIYLSGPETAVDVRRFFRSVHNGGWKFFSPNGCNRSMAHTALRSDIDFTIPFYASNPRFDSNAYFDIFSPYGQHLLLSRATSTVMHDGHPPLWSVDDISERDQSAIDIATFAKWTTLLIVIDGTGSAGSGTIANGHLAQLLPALISAGRQGLRLVVTKFSDYPGTWNTSPDDIPALLLGAFNGINAGTSDAIVALNDAHQTGNGDDTNESQFQGIQLAIDTANGRGWNDGALGIVVYTDAASVVTYTKDVDPYLRMQQRDDGLGPTGHPRLRANNSPSSRQFNQAPRVGDVNFYH